MPGYQFVHIEGYSRSGGKGGRSVGYVLDEAERRPGACPHVDEPGAPTLLHGMPIAALREAHDERAGVARQSVAGGRERAIRKDQLTLMTAVASYPVPWSDLDDAGRIEVEAWERRTIDWLKGQYGDRLATVVRHSDERHPHLHAYVLPDDPAMRAGLLHPGFQAKAAVMDREKPADAEERKALNREDAEIARHFEYGGKIKRIHVDAEQLAALNAGELGVVQLNGRYLLVTAAVLDEAEAIFPQGVALRVDPSAPAGEDPYSDPRYQVPDDLVW